MMVLIVKTQEKHKQIIFFPFLYFQFRDFKKKKSCLQLHLLIVMSLMHVLPPQAFTGICSARLVYTKSLPPVNLFAAPMGELNMPQLGASPVSLQ